MQECLDENELLIKQENTSRKNPRSIAAAANQTQWRKCFVLEAKFVDFLVFFYGHASFLSYKYYRTNYFQILFKRRDL